MAFGCPILIFPHVGFEKKKKKAFALETLSLRIKCDTEGKNQSENQSGNQPSAALRMLIFYPTSSRHIKGQCIWIRGR